MLKMLKCWNVEMLPQCALLLKRKKHAFNISTFQHFNMFNILNILKSQHFNIGIFSTFQRWSCQINPTVGMLHKHFPWTQSGPNRIDRRSALFLFCYMPTCMRATSWQPAVLSTSRGMTSVSSTSGRLANSASKASRGSFQNVTSKVLQGSCNTTIQPVTSLEITLPCSGDTGNRSNLFVAFLHLGELK